MVAHLEPDILDCKVKWPLGSITTNKTSGGDGIPTEPFQIQKNDAVKVLHSIIQQIWKTQQWPQDWKRWVSTPVPQKCTTVFISHASKVILKILPARLQQYYLNWEFPDAQAGFRKDRETRDQIVNIQCIIEKAREFQKTPNFASLTMLKPLAVWITTHCGKFWKRWEYQTTLPASWEICMQVKKQQLELDMEQWTGSQFGKMYVKAVYHTTY